MNSRLLTIKDNKTIAESTIDILSYELAVIMKYC